MIGLRQRRCCSAPAAQLPAPAPAGARPRRPPPTCSTMASPIVTAADSRCVSSASTVALAANPGPRGGGGGGSGGGGAARSPAVAPALPAAHLRAPGSSAAPTSHEAGTAALAQTPQPRQLHSSDHAQDGRRGRRGSHSPSLSSDAGHSRHTRTRGCPSTRAARVEHAKQTGFAQRYARTHIHTHTHTHARTHARTPTDTYTHAAARIAS